MALFERTEKNLKKVNHTPLPERLRVRYNVRNKSKIRTLFLYVVSSIVLIVGISLFYLNFAKKIDAAWFDDNWLYRKAITLTVSSNTSDVTDLDSLITIDTTGITAKLQANCEDLRFTSQSGKLLPYYIHSCTDNSATNKVWVRVDLVPKNTTTYTLYMYYGNPSAAAASDSNRFTLLNGLNAYWTMNESSWNTTSGEIKDYSVTGQNATAFGNATTTSSGKYGNAGDVDGADDYINTGSTTLINRTAFSIATWVYSDANGGYIFEWGKSCETWPSILASTSAFNTWTGPNTGLTTVSYTAPTLSTWTHYVYTYDGTNMRVYKDGVLNAGPTAASTPWDNTTNNLYLGAEASTWTGAACGGPEVALFEHNGRLDDFRIYNRSLSDAEISLLHNDSPGSIASASEPTVNPSASFGSEEKGTGPVAFWRLDEGSGTTTQDSSVNNNDGTLVNTPVWQTEDMCVSGKCLQFSSGSSEYIAITDSDFFSPSVNDITISLWARVPVSATASGSGACGGAGSYLMAKGVVSNWEWGLENDNNTLVCFTAWQADGTNNAVVNSTRTVNDGLWHFYEVTYDYNNLLSLYIDGILVSSTSSFTGSMSNGTAAVTVGSRLSGNYFDGYIDEPKIYNYVRSAAQIKLDYLNSGISKGAGVKDGSNPENAYNALSSGLVGYWKMDESSWTGDCSTTSVTDSSGNGFNGKACPNASAANTTTTARFGKAGGFDGTNDYVNLPTTFSIGASTFTVAMWVKTTQATVGNLFSNGCGGCSNKAQLRFATTVLISEGGSGSGSTTSIIDGVWHHVVGIIDRERQKTQIYVDGKLEDEDVNTVGATLTDSWHMGFSEGDDYFNGQMDEVRVYKRALTPSQVSTLYNFAPGPVGYWKMEEGSGTTAADSSGNGQSGTLMGSGTERWKLGKYGKAGSFNGTDDYLQVGNIVNPGTVNFSLSAWVKADSFAQIPDTNDSSTIHSQYNGSGTGRPWLLIHRNNGSSITLRSFVGGSFTSVGSTNWTNLTNLWKHVAVTYDGTTSRVYLDGKLEGSATVTAESSNGNMNFGAHRSPDSDNEEWDGEIDDIRIYNYARTQKQIVEDMNAGHPAPGSPIGSPYIYYKFDEGYGTSTVQDSSINNQDGTLSSFASPATTISGWTNDGKYGKALSFDGGNDEVTRTLTTSIAGDISVTLWAQVGADTGRYFAFQESTPGLGLNVAIADYIFIDNVGGPSSEIRSRTGFNDNKWHHIAVTRSGTTYYLYIDGLLEGSGTGSLYTYTSFTIGSQGSSTAPLQARMDEFKVYTSALTAEQIKVDYNQGQAIKYATLGVSTSDGKTASDSAATAYCVPGDTTSCSSPTNEWLLEEGGGTSAYNTGTIESNTGTVTGAQWTPGKVGKALSFNATTSQYVSLPSSSGYISASQTVSFWVKLKAQIGVDFWSFASTVPSGENMGWMVQYGDNDSGCGGDKIILLRKWTPEINAEFCQELTVGRWYHITGVWDGTNAILYLDGVLLGSSTSASPTTGTTTGCIGGDSRTSNCGAQNPNAVIDDVRVFNYALTASQAAYNYNRGAPVAHWKFDECQGTTANDSSGNSYTGTIVPGSGTHSSVGDCNSSATTMWYDGRVGKYNSSLSFDASDDYIGLGDQSTLELTTFTISGWAYRLGACSFSTCTIFSKGMSGNTGYALTIDSVSGNYKACIHIRDNTQVVCGTTTINTNTWYYIAGSIDGTTVNIYVNGRLDTSESQTSTPTFSTEQAKIGNRNNNNDIPMNGSLDDIKIFNYPLTANQIRNDYNQGAAVRYGPLTGTP